MGFLLQLILSAFVFIVLSKIIPGFEVKDFKTSLIVAVIFAVLMVLSSLLASPLSFLAAVLAKAVSWIPLIGQPIASLGIRLVSFTLNFIIGSIMLCLTDKFVSGFKMRSLAVGVVAAFLIAAINIFLPMF